MNERAIFEQALEISDPARRRQFLAETCGADAALRARIESLLASHESPSRFLKVPVPEQLQAKVPPAGHPITGKSDTAREDADWDLNEDFHNGPTVTPLSGLSFLGPSSKQGSIGTLGHYEILEVLGQGGFGIVLKAFDEKLHRHVAIKVLIPDVAATSPPRKRFLREARAVAAIRHENIVQVYSVEEQPLPYLVMEFIDGVTLQQKLDGTGPLDLSEIVHIGRQIAAGLAAAHARGLIHRDIKPGNILIENGVERRVKITDFGLARATDDASMTRSGISGTPLYMAPEQAQGQAHDHRADLFSLGSVLYVIASGRPPFRAGSAFAVMKRVVEDTPRPIREIIPGVPEWLCALIEKLHAKKCEDRFQSAQEVAELLARGQESRSESNPHAASASPADARHVKRRQGIARRLPHLRLRWLGVVATIAMIAIIAMVMYRIIPADATPIPRDATPVAGESSSAARETQEHTAASPPETDGTSAGAPSPAIAPFNMQQAGRHQDEWAAYLKTPVEYTNSIGMTFRLIPPGEFTMGMTREEAVAIAKLLPHDDYWKTMALGSTPPHRVRLTRALYMGIHEVTQEQYRKVVGTNPSFYSTGGSGREAVRGSNTMQHPVDQVSVVDAVRFCNALSSRENRQTAYFERGKPKPPTHGNGYRLPTEAEWEWACRAGTTSPWFHGSRPGQLRSTAWYLASSGSVTHPVGQLRSNSFGLFDTHGNVWEWCQDHYDSSAYSRRSTKTAENPLISSSEGTMGVLRGGSRFCIPEHCHSALRSAAGIQVRHEHHGFRVVVEIDIAEAAH